MDIFTIYCLMILGILSIDLSVRLIIIRSKDAAKYNAAGILSLIFLSLTEGQKQYKERANVLKQFFLSLIMILFLTSAIFLLLINPYIRNDNILEFVLILTPLFTMPFFYFLYDLFSIQPLGINIMLTDFRMRGVIALILSSNVVFVSLKFEQNIISLLGHFLLTFIAVAGSFYLCSRLRNKVSSFDAPLQSAKTELLPKILHYLTAILECLYYFIVISLIFIASPVNATFNHAPNLFLTLVLLLAATAIFTKFRFYLNAPLSLSFYEEKLLPISFLFFGITSVLYYYF